MKVLLTVGVAAVLLSVERRAPRSTGPILLALNVWMLYVCVNNSTLIARASGNAYLCDSLWKIFDKFQHFVWIELLWLDEWEVARNEHAAIVEAVCSGDGTAAAELARRHVRVSKINIVRFLQAKNAYQAAVARAS